MTTARCFGGVLDGRWQQTDGRELMAPVMDYDYKAMTFDDPDYGRSPLRVHRYTLQKFVVGMEWVRNREFDYRWGIKEVWNHEPVFFHALIGPGFTVKMVEAWLQGWIEEADNLEAKMQTRPGDKARAEVAELERRIRNQADLIHELRAERVTHEGLPAGWPSIMTTNERLQQTVKRLTTELKGAREAARRGRQEILRLTQQRDRAEATRDRHLAKLLDAREDAEQLKEQRDFYRDRRTNIQSDIIEAQARTLVNLRQQRNRARRALSDIVDSARRSLDGGSAIAGLYWAIDRATQVLE